MSVLDSDSPLIAAKKLSGIHLDGVRCIYDERLSRSKSMCDDPEGQLTHFKEIASDAIEYWTRVSKKPEDREGRKEELAGKLSDFFDRVIRYANHYSNNDLPPDTIETKQSVIKQAQKYQDKLYSALEHT